MLRFPHCLATTLCAVATLGAQAPLLFPEFQTATIEHPLPGAQPLSGSVVRTVAANLTGHHTPDVAILSGWGLAAHAPPTVRAEIYPLVAEAETKYNDIARHPGAAGARDRIVAVGPHGLHLIGVDSASQVTIDSTSGHSDWKDATRIKVGDVDGDGGTDWIGVDGAGETILLQCDGSSTVTSFDTGDPILDYVACEWGGNSGEEILVQTTAELCVLQVDSDGVISEVAAIALAVSDAHLTRARSAYGDIFVIAFEIGTGNDRISTLSAGIFGGSSALVPLGNMDIGSCLASNTTFDGDEDLCITAAGGDRSYVFINQLSILPSLPMFNGGALGGVYVDHAEITGPPLFADLNGNGFSEVSVIHSDAGQLDVEFAAGVTEVPLVEVLLVDSVPELRVTYDHTLGPNEAFDVRLWKFETTPSGLNIQSSLFGKKRSGTGTVNFPLTAPFDEAFMMIARRVRLENDEIVEAFDTTAMRVVFPAAPPTLGGAVNSLPLPPGFDSNPQYGLGGIIIPVDPILPPGPPPPLPNNNQPPAN